ncbi:MAG: chromosomal replication initiator protein DnaA [Rickettsiales bacterium]|jgi:chromosomal replication initiator protein|nr:chromosomal replication initiator protein DnaA [Rickettsiales bacterium]
MVCGVMDAAVAMGGFCDWKEVATTLRREFGDDVYNSWLAELELVSLTDYEIVLSVPTNFVRDWLLREYFEERTRNARGERQCLRRGIKQVLLDYFPRLVSFSVVVRREERKIPIIPSKTTSISPHGNVYSLGTELNRNYTFDSYVVGTANKLAFEAARNFVEGDKLGNPLFIYGGVGLGKSHLCQAIAWAMGGGGGEKGIVYLSAEKFMYLFVQALRTQEIGSFKERLRNVDVLLVDDIQFITGKDKTQREFFYTFDTLVADGKKIVLVCDKAPANLESLDEKLRSRMNGGLLVAIEEFDYSLRLALVKKKSEELKLNLRDDLLEFLAKKLNRSCREIEGCLRRLFLKQSVLNTKFEKIADLENVLADSLDCMADEMPEIETIQRKVAEHFGLSPVDLRSKKKHRDLVIPRHLAMYLSRELTSLSLLEIAEKFGRKNHSTVIHGINHAKRLVETEQEMSTIARGILGQFSRSRKEVSHTHPC